MIQKVGHSTSEFANREVKRESFDMYRMKICR